MNSFKGNINLANMLLDCTTTADVANTDEDSPLPDIMSMLTDLEPKLFELIASLMTERLESLLKVCILVVDDLTATLARYT